MTIPLFQLIEIETCNACTRQCWYCLHGQRPPMPRVDMPSETIDAILTELGELQYTGWINFFSANEPLLDSRMPQLIMQAKALVPSARTRIFTNGDLLTQRLLDTLLRSGLTALKISLHDVAALDKIEKLSLPAQVQVGHYYRNPCAVWRNHAGLIPQTPYDGRYAHWTCPRPSWNLVLRYDGQLKLCADDMAGVAFPDALRFPSQSLRQLWESLEMEHYRALLAAGRRAELALCRDCNFIHPAESRPI